MLKKLFIISSTVVFISACQSHQPKSILPMTHEQKQAMAFTCTHEQKPVLSAEIQKLYLYAHYHDLHNMWSPKDGVWESTLPYYRIAAAHGDYEANLRLQYLLTSGRLKVKKSEEEAVALNNQLMQQLSATAHYLTYQYLLKGILKSKKDGAYVYLRKAADLGHPGSQYIISEMMMNTSDNQDRAYRRNLSQQFLQCASEGGDGEASQMYGIDLKNEKRYKEAELSFRRGIKQGDSSSTNRLSNAYEFDLVKNPIGSNEYKTYYLAVQQDLERAKRYQKIQDFLFKRDYLNPTVPDLDQIVPLPPAKLPAWDGKIAFQRWFEGPSPEKPSDELMERLAKEKGLDPQTGLPLKK